MTATYEVTHRQDCLVRDQEAWQPRKVLKVDAELTFIRARKMGNDPYIEVTPHLTAEPMIGNRALLREWLKTTIWWIQWLLYEFSEMPDELGRLGIDLDVHTELMSWKRPF